MERVSTQPQDSDLAVAVTAPRANSRTQRAPRAARKFTAALGCSALLMGASACGAEDPLGSVFGEPEANQTLAQLYGEYQQVIDSPNIDKPTRQLLKDQANSVREEWLRLCGEDSEGNAPAECTDEAQADAAAVDPGITIGSLNDSLIDAVVSAEPIAASSSDGSETSSNNTADQPDKNQPSAELLLDLTTDMAPVLDDLDPDELSELPLTEYSPEFEKVREAAHAGWFATGLGLAKDDGTHAWEIRPLRSALRTLEEDLTAHAESLDGTSPAPLPAGYTLREGLEQPENSAEVMPFIEQITPTVTDDLREATLGSRAVDDRRYAAHWLVYLAQEQSRIAAEATQDQ